MMSKYIFSKDGYFFIFYLLLNVATHDEKQCNKIITYLPLQLACNHVIFPEIAFIDGCKSK